MSSAHCYVFLRLLGSLSCFSQVIGLTLIHFSGYWAAARAARVRKNDAFGCHQPASGAFHVDGPWTFVSLNSKLESNEEEEEFSHLQLVGDSGEDGGDAKKGGGGGDPPPLSPRRDFKEV